jgi:hypothetical protein
MGVRATITTNTEGNNMNGITLADIQVGTIIVTNGKVAIVDEVNYRRHKNPIAYKNNTEHRGYICGIEQIQAVLGNVSIEKWDASKGPSNVVPTVTRLDHWAMPENLQKMGLKPGDVISVSHGRKIVEATFTGYSSSRPKHPVSYSINGKKWKGPGSIIIRKVRDGVSKAA